MQKNITIGFPVLNLHELTVSCLKLIQENTHEISEIIIVDNGSDQELLSFKGMQSLDSSLLNKLKVIRNDHNLGVRDAINQIWKATTNPYLCLIHNDVQILEKDWDLKVLKTFKENPEAGIVGCYGSKGLGNFNIYQVPYEQNQLARNGNVSGSSMDKSVHGFRGMATEKENVTMFDGFCLIVKKELLDKIGGLSSSVLPIHHMYDAYLCVESLKLGYENIVIPLNFFHSGGASDTSQDWTKGTGLTKQEVHTSAHPLFYEYGKGILPIFIEDIFSEETGLIIGYSLYMNHALIKTRIY
jgi:GT2 family glycosyltransferase